MPLVQFAGKIVNIGLTPRKNDAGINRIDFRVAKAGNQRVKLLQGLLLNLPGNVSLTIPPFPSQTAFYSEGVIKSDVEPRMQTGYHEM